MKRVLTIMAVCAAVALCGCGAGDCRSYMSEIRGREWSRPVTILLPNADTTGLCDMRIALRHNGRAGKSEVAVSVRTETPDSLFTEEMFAIRLADDGRSRSAQHEASALYRTRVRLSREGEYRITITPAQPVRGVSAVGVELSPAAESKE